MLLHNASVFPAKSSADESPLLAALRPGISVAELASSSGDQAGADEVLAELLDLDARGVVRIELPVQDAALLNAYRKSPDILVADPGLDNVAAYERNWELYPDLYDFVNADNEVGALKAFERDLYFELLAAHLDALPAGANVLDAGCGVGRFTVEFVRRFGSVACLDSSPKALKCAVRHSLAAGATGQTLTAHLGDVRRMGMFGDGAFDAVFAMELICYQTDPAESLREIARVLKPGGLAVISVEGKYGGMLTDPRIALENIDSVLRHSRLHVERDVYVRYFTEAGLHAAIEASGLHCLEVMGSHYLPDGPLARIVTEETLRNADARAKIVDMERTFAADPVLRPLARGWIGVARKE